MSNRTIPTVAFVPSDNTVAETSEPSLGRAI
jgi:hypothetical protein